ncbi:hypothetical protein JCM10213v2_000508 [Rhodosporidiobolus nylandii]
MGVCEAWADCSLHYGTQTYLVPLFYAAKAFEHNKGAMDGIALVRLRKQQGTLAFQKAETRAVGRIPVEVWDAVRKAVSEEGRLLANAALDEAVRAVFCDRCSEEADERVPDWVSHPGFVWTSTDWRGKRLACEQCGEKAAYLLSDLYGETARLLPPFLARYGLVTACEVGKSELEDIRYDRELEAWERLVEGHCHPLHLCLVEPIFADAKGGILASVSATTPVEQTRTALTSPQHDLMANLARLATPGVSRRYRRLFEDWLLPVPAAREPRAGEPDWTPGPVLSLSVSTDA